MARTKLEDLKAAAKAATDEARDIATKADTENRDMTDDERSKFDAAMVKGRELVGQIRTAKSDEAVLLEAKNLAAEIGEVAVADVEAQGQTKNIRERVKSLGLQVVESTQFKNLTGQWAGGIAPNGTRVQSEPIAVKALITGSSDTSAGAFVVNEQSGIVESLGRRPLTLRDVISVRRTRSDAVEYVVQTSHTNAAATVAEATSSAAPTAPGGAGALVNNAGGGYKPEGAWAYARQVATVKTIAEWVPATKRSLADVAALEGLINDELRLDLAETEENQAMTGNGAGENLDGITHVSGTQAQTFSTDIFETVRKAITKARVVGRVNPNAIALAPLDVEKIDLARDAEDRFYSGGPFFGGPRTLWGVPILETESLTAGTGVVGDFRKAVLWDREQASVTFSDSHADFYIRNLVAILAEERVAFAVTRPTAFVITATV